MADNRVLIKIEADISNLQKSLQKVEQSIKGVEDKSKNSFNKMGESFKKVGGILATAFAVDKIKDVGMYALESASFVEEMENKFNVVFGKMSKDVDAWADEFGKSIGRTKTEIKNGVANLGDLLTGYGMTSKEASKLSQEVIALSYDLASFNNVQDADAIDRMTKGILGEHEGLKALGIAINETTLQGKMLEMGLSGQFAKLDEVTKAQVRYQIMLDQTKNAQGDAVRSADSYENSVKKLKASIQNVAESFGKNLLPLATEVVQAITPVVERLIPLAGDLGSALYDGVKQAVESIQGLGDKFQEFKGWVEENKLLCIALASSFGVLATAIGLYTLQQNWMTVSTYVGVTALNVWSAVCGVATTVTTALGKAVGFLMSPFGIVAMVIIGVIAVVYLLIKHWDTVCKVASKVGNIVMDTLVGAFEFCKNKSIEIWNNVTTFLSNAFQTICNVVKVGVMFIGEIIKLGFTLITLPWRMIWENCKGFLIPIFEGIRDYLSNVLSSIGNYIHGKLTDIYNYFANIFNTISNITNAVWDAISNYIRAKSNEFRAVVFSVLNAIKNVMVNTFNAIKNVVLPIWDAIKTGISNKINEGKTYISNKFQEMKNTMSNISNSIKGVVTNTFNAIKDALWKPIENAKNKIKSVFDTIKNIFNTKLKPNIKLPKINVTGKFSLNPPSVPKFNLGWYQTGGIFTGASVIGVGENGDEAVVPLSNKRRMKPFASAVASMIGEVSNGNTRSATPNTTINISQMVVREDADITKIANELNRLNKRENRKKGIV